MSGREFPEVSMEKIVETVKKAKRFFEDSEAAGQIHQKGQVDFVTQVDVRVQEYLYRELTGLYPQIQFMGEEKDNSSLDPEGSLWILDPVDGTTNLIHGYPMSCVSLALSVKRTVTAAVIYNPYTEEVFTARKGKGAFLNGKPVHVSRTEKLASGIVDFGTAPYYHEHADWNFQKTKEIFLRCQDIRRMGSAALAMAYVACGRCDGSYELYLKPWDYAAGLLMVQEAGGVVTDFSGQFPDPTRPSAVLATNGRIHEELRAYLQDFAGAKQV